MRADQRARTTATISPGGISPRRLPLQRSSQDWWRSPEVCKGRRNAHVGVGLITIAHHEKNLMVLLPSWPAWAHNLAVRWPADRLPPLAAGAVAKLNPT